MDLTCVDKIARALLYEGFLLYPYRTSSLKNRYRATIGTLYPRASGTDPWRLQMECILVGCRAPKLELCVRFLQFMPTQHDGNLVDPSRDAQERMITLADVEIAALVPSPYEHHAAFASGVDCELAVHVRLAAVALDEAMIRLRVEVENVSVCSPHAAATGLVDPLSQALVSPHVIAKVQAATFASLIDPEPGVRDAVASCCNIGTFPVRVGDPSERDMVLSGPLILGDYPAVADESPGDLFDATEIDEILTLRILTLSDDEKRELRSGDNRARALLERTEKLALDETARLHGAVRDVRPSQRIEQGGRELRPGNRVKLAPRARGDIFDIALRGRTATIASVEVDYEGRAYVAVTVDDDPGRDLGADGKPGHRFYFDPTEVVPL